MKGRPITAEEFERMLMVVPRVVTKELCSRCRRAILMLARLMDHPKHRVCPEAAVRAEKLSAEIHNLHERAQRVAESWRHYLRGLWWSGLRLEESLEL